MTVVKRAALFSLLFLLPAVYGCGFFSGGADGPRGGAPEQAKITLTVYRPSQEGDLLYPEKYDRRQEPGIRPELAALNVLLKEKPLDQKHVNIFPPGVRVVALQIKDGLAEVDFSQEILKSDIGGSLHEMLLVSSLVNTLTEFPAITRVQLLVEGKKIDTIGGHTDVLDPLKRNESLIGKP
jgi:spore germination protein GerM